MSIPSALQSQSPAMCRRAYCDRRITFTTVSMSIQRVGEPKGANCGASRGAIVPRACECFFETVGLRVQATTCYSDCIEAEFSLSILTSRRLKIFQRFLSVIHRNVVRLLDCQNMQKHRPPVEVNDLNNNLTITRKRSGRIHVCGKAGVDFSGCRVRLSSSVFGLFPRKQDGKCGKNDCYDRKAKRKVRGRHPRLSSPIADRKLYGLFHWSRNVGGAANRAGTTITTSGVDRSQHHPLCSVQTGGYCDYDCPRDYTPPGASK